jgi:hypothetical protein
MPTEAFETLLSPYTKLARANMDLLAKFSTSPEVMSQTLGTAQKMADQGTATASNLLLSNAFSDFVMGLLQNWMEFWSELSQTTMSFMDQSSETFLKKAPAMAGEAARAVSEMAQGKTPRSRPTAA